MSLYHDLTHNGVFDADAQLLEQLYGTEPDFMIGLEQMAECYFDNKKPSQFPPMGEPWAGMYAAVMSSNGSSAFQAVETYLKTLDPALQMALSGALSQIWQRVTATQAAKGKRKHIKTREYIQVLQHLGYEFRMNECNDEVEVNQEPITDPVRAHIRSELRDSGYAYVNVAEDAYLAHAYRNRYHPIREYLQGLSYDGGDHIGALASHFHDKHGIFPLWLRRWLIGAVAKVMEGGQNPMLVLDGPQGCGKSFFASWLCPIDSYFIEGPINPDDKDAHVRLLSNWIWEVSELGATTRKADREALKFFITQKTVTVRKAYGRYDTRKLAMASLIGTVNNEAGILSDKTGNRRFLVCKLEAVDWAYSEEIDVNQVWAEAQAAYLSGEPWLLTVKEQQQAHEINEDYEIDDPIEGLLLKYFRVDTSVTGYHWMPSAEILQTLEMNGLRGQTRSNAMGLASVMTKLGVNKRRCQNDQGQRVWGYDGVELII